MPLEHSQVKITKYKHTVSNVNPGVLLPLSSSLHLSLSSFPLSFPFSSHTVFFF